MHCSDCLNTVCLFVQKLQPPHVFPSTLYLYPKASFITGRVHILPVCSLRHKLMTLVLLAQCYAHLSAGPLLVYLYCHQLLMMCSSTRPNWNALSLG